MNKNDPIRLSDFRRPEAVASTITRGEAERQFKFSFALVIVLTLATLTALATLPISGWENGYGTAQMAANLR